MRIIEPAVEIISAPDEDEVLEHLERCGRICYKSEGRIKDGSAREFISSIVKRGHEAVLEHASVTVRIICDRGVSHELVRHRLAAYCQESTRYCNYAAGRFGGEITVIRPHFLDQGTSGFRIWKEACEEAERAYFALLDWGCSPQEARDVLPTSLKTEIAMTCDIREWRHFLRLRTAPAAHPQMRQVAWTILNGMCAKMPALFGDILEQALTEEDRIAKAGEKGTR